MQEVNSELEKKAQGRQQFKHEGRLVYEWDQTLDDINIYILPPKACLKKYQDEVKAQLQPGQVLPKLDVVIQPKNVKIGIKGNPPFLHQELEKYCDSDDSYWLIEDEELHIILQKAHKAELWPCVFKGHEQMDPLTQNEIQKKLLKERFQEEHPGFDFSQAQVNGMVPNAREFMGGVKYQ